MQKRPHRHKNKIHLSKFEETPQLKAMDLGIYQSKKASLSSAKTNINLNN